MPWELPKLLYRYEEVAELIGLSLYTVRCLVEEGELERIYVRTQPRITADSILSYVKRQLAKRDRQRTA